MIRWIQSKLGLFDALMSASLLFFSANMITNVANYGTQLMLARLLGPMDYGSYNALMAMLVLLAVPITALSFVIVRYVACCDTFELVVIFYKRSFFKLIVFAFLLLLCIAVLVPFIQSFLHIQSLWAVAWLAPVAMITLFQPFNMAFSQGLQNFRGLAVSQAFSGPVRFMLSVGAAAIGWGISGAMFATFLVGAVCWILSALPLRHIWRSQLVVEKKEASSIVWRDVVPVFIATVSFIFMTQVDVILVKHLFSPELSGFYSSAALLGKAILYIPGAVIVGLIPMVASQSHASWKLLCKALWLTAGLSGFGAFLLWLMPAWILKTFFGAHYLPAAPLLKYFGLSMLSMAFVLVIKAYFIAKQSYFFSYVMLFGAVGMTFSVIACAKSPMDVVFLVGLWGAFVAFIGFVVEWRMKCLQDNNWAMETA